MSKMIGVKEVSEMLGVSESKAYDYIRKMNDELRKDNFLTVRGRVPLTYVEHRFFGFQSGQKGAAG